MPKPARSILVFAGVFDPVHKGHLSLLDAALRHLRPDAALVLPSSDRLVHKPRCFFPAALRLKFLRLALARRRARVLDIEAVQSAPQYSWQTLRRLKKLYPGARFFYLIGSDNLSAIASWGRAAELWSNQQLFLVVGRRRERGLSRQETASFSPFPRTVWLPGIYPEISSSAIRRLLIEEGVHAKAKLERWLEKPVLKALFDSPTLGLRIERYLEAKLPAARFQHTLAVARWASQLARRHGVSEYKARLAALLHDASRTRVKFSSPSEAVSHGGRSAVIAKKVFGIEDREVLEAIACHTLGKPGMGRLARLIYIADASSPDRGFPEAAQIRRAAGKNLEEALRLAARIKMDYLERAGQWIHPAARRFLNSLERR